MLDEDLASGDDGGVDGKHVDDGGVSDDTKREHASHRDVQGSGCHLFKIRQRRGGGRRMNENDDRFTRIRKKKKKKKKKKTLARPQDSSDPHLGCHGGTSSVHLDLHGHVREPLLELWDEHAKG